MKPQFTDTATRRKCSGSPIPIRWEILGPYDRSALQGIAPADLPLSNLGTSGANVERLWIPPRALRGRARTLSLSKEPEASEARWMPCSLARFQRQFRAILVGQLSTGSLGDVSPGAEKGNDEGPKLPYKCILSRAGRGFDTGEVPPFPRIN